MQNHTIIYLLPQIDIRKLSALPLSFSNQQTELAKKKYITHKIYVYAQPSERRQNYYMHPIVNANDSLLGRITTNLRMLIVNHLWQAY